MANTLLSYLFSLIGFVPIEQQNLLLQQQQQQNQQQQQIQQQTNSDEEEEEEEECEHLSSSGFMIEPSFNKNNNTDWLFNLSKMALFQILTTTIQDYPQVANVIHKKRYDYEKKDEIEELKNLRSQVKSIAQSLDKQRPSEQFGRANEIYSSLNQILHVTMIENQDSVTSLISLIILAQESLNSPSEVRQHLFSNVKFGRTIILEISKLLKNFNQYNCSRDLNYKWSFINNNNNDSWFDTLQFICNKLSRYDLTWEYRKEYEEVINISYKYFIIK